LADHRDATHAFKNRIGAARSISNARSALIKADPLPTPKLARY
jgi:hypothetical protein